MTQTVKIGPLVYRVVETEGLRSDETDRRLYGQIDYNAGEIRIDPKAATAQHQRITLWHEIVHGILTQYGIQKQDERVVDALAYGIAEVLQDNPWLGTFEDPHPDPLLGGEGGKDA